MILEICLKKDKVPIILFVLIVVLSIYSITVMVLGIWTLVSSTENNTLIQVNTQKKEIEDGK